MLQSSLLLPKCLLFHLLLGTQLLLLELTLSSFLCLALLVLYHLLQRTVFQILLLLREHKKVFLFLLLILDIFDFPLNFILKPLFIHLQILFLLILNSLILRHPHLFFFFFLTQSFHLLFLCFQITLLLGHYVLSTLFRLINLFPSFLLFLLEELKSVRKELLIFLSSFSGNFGSHKLTMQSFIVVVIVNVQIHLLERLLL